jgi:steroid 5-alpha reductase family enzyme
MTFARNIAIYEFVVIQIAWFLCISLNNGSYVDIGWPIGFTSMAIVYALSYRESFALKLLACAYVICGLRFIVGWIFGRKHHLHEDKRWALWRERWRNGEGWFGLRSVPLNFFFFYHAQSLANAVFLQCPLYLVAHDTSSSGFHTVARSAAVVVWIVGFAVENTADVQLTNWWKANRKTNDALAVCTVGLWSYSRHPNYFGEWLIWVAYWLFALPSVTSLQSVAWLSCLPFVAYYFLVHFTGVFMAEQSSMKRRPSYRAYAEQVPCFFPSFTNKKFRLE